MRIHPPFRYPRRHLGLCACNHRSETVNLEDLRVSFCLFSYPISIWINDKCPRPAPVLVNHFINFIHNVYGFIKSNDDFLVMGNVFVGQHTAGARVLAALGLAVLEPLLANLISADVKAPHLLRHTPEAARLRLLDIRQQRPSERVVFWWRGVNSANGETILVYCVQVMQSPCSSYAQ